tara:strand:- start:6672 stop:6968 length:297 start_codon:yes stop_codon:yes gene_type:complete
VTNTKERGQIDIVVKPEGGTDNDQFMVSIEIEAIAIYNSRARNNFRREDRGKRKISINIIGKSKTPGLISRTDDTRVEVEFWLEDKRGVLGASAARAA